MTLRKQSQPQPPGGEPTTPPPLQLPDWPPDRDRIEQAVLAELRSGQWSAYEGPASENLQTRLAREHAVAHVRLVSSGTAAVELALRGCRVGPGDEVILAAFDYPGNFRCVEATGATSVIIDIAPGRWTVDVEQIAAAVSAQTRAVIVSHLYGSMADAAAIRELADRHGFYFIEDACQAPGARVAGRPAGTWGHAGTLSFGGSKLVSCGNGGAILTEDARIEGRMKLFAERPSNAFAMSQLQAAALIPQLESLPFWTERRRRAVEFLRTALGDSPPNPAGRWSWGRREPQDAENAYYKLAWLAADLATRDRQVRRGREMGLPLGSGFPVIARRSASPRSSTRPSSPRRRVAGSLPNSERAAATTLVLDHRVLAGDEAFLQTLAARLLDLQKV